MSFFAKLAVLISANTSEFKAGLDDATKSTKKFEAEQKRAMRESAKAAKELEANLRLAAGALTAVGAATLYAFNYADKINDTAKAFDITIASLLSMRGALQGAGGEAENMATLLTKLATNAQAAKDGSDQIRGAFDKLGISGKEVENLDLDELFALTAESLSKLTNATERQALAQQLLGRAAKGVDWKEYWQNYSQGKGTTESVTAAIEAGATAWDNLEKAGRKALETLLVLIKPVSDFINFLARAAEKTKSGTGTGSLFGAEMGMPELAPLDEFAAPGKPPAAASARGKVKPGGYTTGKASEAGFAAATEAVRQQTEEMMRQISAMVKREQMESKFLAMTKNQREIAQEVFRIEEDRDKLIATAQKEIEIEQKRANINKEKIKALEDQIDTIKYGKQVEIEAITDIIRKRQEEQQSFSTGWNRAFNQYAEDAQNYARVGEQAFNSVISNMDNALMNFVNTGKFRFKDFAASVIMDLIRIQMRMQMMQLFNQGRNFFSAFSFFGTQSPAPVFDAGVGFAADGGQIDGPTIVGEHGPELFIPNRGGAVIPNQQMASKLSGDNYVTNNYISAIDVKSFEERILNSPNAVWAANKYADKSLQIGRGRT